MGLLERLRALFRRAPVVVTARASRPARGRVDHVVVLDGTMSSLSPGTASNAGLAFQLLGEGGPSPGRTLYYEQGTQLETWRDILAVAFGRGINRQIRRAYGHLASHYRPGDRIFLIGYSRGAYAVRSLAGAIDRVGLLTRESATERNVSLAYRHYRRGPDGVAAKAFRARFCHAAVEIEMVGVWDTVKALGLRLPLLWMLTERRHAFHSHRLGLSVRYGAHALALGETRVAFAPVMWQTREGREGVMEQVWFRGAHPDVGGQIGALHAARPLSNIPLVWMLERMEARGLQLPEGWRARFPCDPAAPSVGTWRGLGALFLLRERRVVGVDPSERLHASAAPSAPAWVARAFEGRAANSVVPFGSTAEATLAGSTPRP